MRSIAAILWLLCCTGCAERATFVYHVADAADLRPISGAHVCIQPWAPIHPFWPAADQGTTDSHGDVRLSLPTGYWWNFQYVQAKGYTTIFGSTDNSQSSAAYDHSVPVSEGTWGVFCMKRDPVSYKLP